MLNSEQWDRRDMASNDPIFIAQRFAEALDESDFVEASRYLSPDCCYRTGNEDLIGPEAILASYSKNAEWASQAPERVLYESLVERQADETMRILFTARIVQGGLTHKYHCRQELVVNQRGKIVAIVHEELPGEREKLNEFLARCGINRH